MKTKHLRFIALIATSFFLVVTSIAIAAPTPASPDVFNTGVWVQHPGIVIGKLFSSDPRMVMLAGDGNSKLHAWFSDGSVVPGFPKTLANHATAIAAGGTVSDANHYVNSTPALVDINGDGNLEIFVGSGDGYVYGFDNQGHNLPGWPQFSLVSPRDDKYGVFSSVAVADLDRDGNYEVIAGTWGHRVIVWNAENGTLVPGWPLDVLDTVWSSPAVFDADGDGDLEFVIGIDGTVPSGGLLKMFHHDGSEVSGWPQVIDQVIWSSPVVGDIDDDGEPEIVVGTGHYYDNPRGEYVTAYEKNGTPVAGWPVSLSDGNGNTDNRVFASPALADVDGDGTLETFVGALDGYMYCINSNGSVRWSASPATPLSLDPKNFAMLSSPVVGDIDGDGRLEVVVGGGWHLTAFDGQTGAYEPGYPFYTGDLPANPMQTWSSPTIADFDGDGLIEIAIGNGRKDLAGWPTDAGGVRVYHEVGSASDGTPLGETGISKTIAPWTRFRKNNAGTAVTDEFLQSGPAKTANISNLSIAPFIISPDADGLHDSATIAFRLTVADKISVSIHDRTGAKVADVITGSNLGAGNRSVVWNGNVSAGGPALDGMYTCRVSGEASLPVQATLGVTRTIPEIADSWYLAEGSTVGFEGFITIQNPNDSTNLVTVTFFNQDGSTKVYTENVAPQTRTTVPMHGEVPDKYSVSMRVEGQFPIVAERVMYFNDPGTGNSAAHNSIGVTNTARSWYFPGNRTNPGDENFITIVNPSTTSSAQLTARFLSESQPPVTRTYTVTPTSRFTIAVHGVLPSQKVSVEILSSSPVSAERVFYFGNRTGGAAGIGAVSPGLSWYFAEGDTADASTSLELMNPGNSSANVTVNFLLENGTVIPANYTLAANRRRTINASAEIGLGQRFAIEVLSNRPIVAERWMFAGSDIGDTIGSPILSKKWFLAEGFTAFGYETWITVSNPGTQTANVQVTFQQQNGVNVIRNYQLAGRNRLKVYANAVVDPTSVSTKVTSDVPIVVERIMKFNSRRGVHQSLGVR